VRSDISENLGCQFLSVHLSSAQKGLYALRIGDFATNSKVAA
jgi:hypothetical protein